MKEQVEKCYIDSEVFKELCLIPEFELQLSIYLLEYYLDHCEDGVVEASRDLFNRMYDAKGLGWKDRHRLKEVFCALELSDHEVYRIRSKYLPNLVIYSLGGSETYIAHDLVSESTVPYSVCIKDSRCILDSKPIYEIVEGNVAGISEYVRSAIANLESTKLQKTVDYGPYTLEEAEECNLVGKIIKHVDSRFSPCEELPLTYLRVVELFQDYVVLHRAWWGNEEIPSRVSYDQLFEYYTGIYGEVLGVKLKN